jgi:hypothetical protein
LTGAVGELLGLLGTLLERIFTSLPAVVIGWKYPPKKVAESFFIVLAKPDALQLQLSGAIALPPPS